MTDRELLEAAAKAAGYELRRHPDGTLYSDCREKHYFAVWNPLTEDGDALRLAVKLGMGFEHYVEDNIVEAYSNQSISIWELTGDDPYAATRRAIVRAAAEIGRTM